MSPTPPRGPAFSGVNQSISLALARLFPHSLILRERSTTSTCVEKREDDSPTDTFRLA